MSLYDSQCADLAQAFLEDKRGTTEYHVHELAQRIQDTIEEYLEELDKRGEEVRKLMKKSERS